MSKVDDIYVDFKTLKVGDRFVESEYGSTLFLTVITKPKLERPDYMTFKAKSDEGRIVDYGFSYPSGAYNPTIWHPAVFGEGTLELPQRLSKTDSQAGGGQNASGDPKRKANT